MSRIPQPWVPRHLAAALVVGFFASAPLNAQTPRDKHATLQTADSIAIRALASQFRPPRSPSSIFWSGAYPKPMIGRADTTAVKAFASARMEQRRNSTVSHETVRLEVASGGDMAYEFYNFTLFYDMADTKEHVSFPGSGLRVWKKINGQWEIAADVSNAWADPKDKPRR